jgi:hypothetical protein
MKKLLATLLMLATLSMTALAADDIAAIRETYNHIKAQIANPDPINYDRPDSTCITIDRMLPGSGIQHRTTRIYYQNDDWYPGCDECSMPKILLATLSYNIAVWEYYYEYLFDYETHQLLFFYERHIDYDSGNPVESRLYFKNEKLIKAVPADAGTATDVQQALYNANHIKDVFNLVTCDL